MTDIFLWIVLVLIFFYKDSVKAFRDDFVALDLQYGIVKGYSPYITFIHSPVTAQDRSCSAKAVIKINFSGPYKGVKFLLEYGDTPRLWTMDISDSETGDGYGGDNGTTSNMAEVHIHNRQMRLYGNALPGYVDASTNGGHLMKVMDNFVKKGSKVTIDISDERIQWTNGKKVEFYESPYLFTLSGQQPTFGRLDYDLYAGFNRVISGDHRVGSGLCRVSISLYKEDDKNVP